MTVADLGLLPQIALCTLAAVLMVGLGFLPRPSPATLLWSAAFVSALIYASLTSTAAELGAETLRRAALGALLTPQALIWAGLRAWRGAASHWWLVLPFTGASAAVLALVDDGPAFSIAFRVVYLAAAVFPALTLLELRRIPERRNRMLLPLAVMSGAFTVIAIVNVAMILTMPASGTADLTLTRNVNSLGMLVNIVCSLVTLLWLAQRSVPQEHHDPAHWQHFSAVATDRLRRAQERGERSWSVLSVRLDDADDVRQAWGETAFVELAQAFERRVQRAFPAEADIGHRAQGWLVVLVPRATEVLREQVRTLLHDVVSLHETVSATVRISASIGWASVGDSGYDLDHLVRVADHALEEAAVEGGDRWRRVRA
ncbi:diguanylate cyclase domain-containing protein [Microbacterium sp.]|uniref:diguanylate cyclase domain-containing protein n=1 Tax=Microbacterium sp. TaxID=51671 RepID=UPI0028114CD1|nr:diguanylate cyclase [Microbacterium sp.]